MIGLYKPNNYTVMCKKKKRIKVRCTRVMVHLLIFVTESTSLMKYTMASKLAFSQYFH